MTKSKGLKAAGLRYDLIPPEALAELAYVYTVGAEKYEARNWELGYREGLSHRAAMSHLLKDMAREDDDGETKAKHLAQVMFHCCALIAFRARGLKTAEDDRGEANIDYIHEVAARQLPPVKKFRGK